MMRTQSNPSFERAPLIRLAMQKSGPIRTYDPARIRLDFEAVVLHQLFGSLVNMENDGSVGPGLAESFHWAGDEIRFRLRAGLRTIACSRTVVVFDSTERFLAEVDGIDRRSPTYVDEELGDGVRGTDYVVSFRKAGFSEIRLATGHPAHAVGRVPGLTAVVGKDPPWLQGSSGGGAG